VPGNGHAGFGGGPLEKGLHRQVPRHAAYPAPTLQKEIWDKRAPLLTGEPDHLVEERGHGRINRWSTWTTPAGIDFPYAEQIACVRRDVYDLDGQAISKEIALAVTSAPTDRAGPADLHTHVRQHWRIENKSHYVRDTTWQDDHHKAWIGNGPHSMATLRNLALGLLRLNGKLKIKEATEEICRDRNRALHLLAT
jgi:hypothetical protein